jgi:hypothetical protein
MFYEMVDYDVQMVRLYFMYGSVSAQASLAPHPIVHYQSFFRRAAGAVMEHSECTGMEK